MLAAPPVAHPLAKKAKVDKKSASALFGAQKALPADPAAEAARLLEAQRSAAKSALNKGQKLQTKCMERLPQIDIRDSVGKAAKED